MTEQSHTPPDFLSPKDRAALFNDRTISKRHDPEGRKALAAQIAEIRTTSQTLNKRVKEALNGFSPQTETGSPAPSLEAAIAAHTQDIAVRREALLVRLKAKFGFGDQKLKQLETELESLLKRELEADASRKELDKLPKASELIKAYYEKMAYEPLSQIEKTELLKPEVLSSLSMEEYIALWKRLNPYFLSHVTRQGFRDHNGMIYHSAGLQEFHHGFTNLIKDEKLLRPPLALKNLRVNDPDSVREYIKDWVLTAPNETEALERLDRLLHFHLAAAPKYADSTAIHFAAQMVADRYYGSETGNEVFFIFPSDFIASQYDYAFNGWEKDFTRPQSDDKWNDIFVWPDSLSNPGITIDAGVAFLPADTQVDQETGSRYASQIVMVEGKEQRTMVKDETIIKLFKEILTRESFLEKLKQNGNASNYDLINVRESIHQELNDTLSLVGISKERIMAIYNALLDKWFVQEWTDETTKMVLENSNAIFREAENTISSQEYWEGFFAKNPALRPKHIVYYHGSPTSAVFQFQQKHGIGQADTSKTEGNLLGFDSHMVKDMTQDPRANRGYDELKSTATAMITEQYAAPKPEAE